MLNYLKVYHLMGWPLFPCLAWGPKAKAPLTEHGHKDATFDWQQIEAWHRQFPGCAWGVATSAERAALDVDSRHNGDKHLALLTAAHGALPSTPQVFTGGGGHHHWLRCPPGTKCKSITKSDKPEYEGKSSKPDSITLKAEGGYVIVPPSKINIPEHEGRAYAWKKMPWDMPLAEAPAWLLGVKPKTEAPTEAENPWVVQPACADLLTHPGSPEGERRKTLCQLIGVHLARGDSPASITALAEAWAGRCSPPLDEWQKHVRGLLAKEESLRRTTGGAALHSAEAGKEGINSEPEPEPRAQAELIPSFPCPSKSPSDGPSPELIPSFPSPDEEEAAPEVVIHNTQAKAEAEAQAEAEVESNWPILRPEAYHGLFGEMLQVIEPETEADPAGILLGWLTCFGNIVGRGAWVQVGPRQHHPALYVGIVGRTSDAKGDGWAVSLWPFKQVEPAWAATCIAHGVGSGEGLLERVADEQLLMDKEGNAKVIPGATDKRCLLRLSELSCCFKKGRRENATLSEHLREAWDGEPIHVPNRKGNALATSGYAVSVFGDVTPGVLRKLLESGSEGFDGFANRFLWAACKRCRFLPAGGSMEALRPYLGRLQSALAFAKSAGEAKRDADAESLWAEVYPTLATSGDNVPHTDRARPYVVRLALLYALADCSAVIRVEHLRAALAVWDYCRESARLIFGGHQPEPDPLWLQLLNIIARNPGITRSNLLRAFRTADAEALGEALAHLERSGLAYRRMLQPDGGGRPAECWFPGHEPEGDGGVNDNRPVSPGETSGRKELTPGEEPGPDAGKEGNNSEADAPALGKERKEGKNSPPEPGPAGPEPSYFLPSQAPGPGEGELAVVIQTPTADPSPWQDFWHEETVMRKPWQTPYPELNALLTPDSLPVVMFRSAPGGGLERCIRLSVDADAEAVVQLRRYPALTLEPWRCRFYPRRYSAEYPEPMPKPAEAIGTP